MIQHQHNRKESRYCHWQCFCHPVDGHYQYYIGTVVLLYNNTQVSSNNKNTNTNTDVYSAVNAVIMARTLHSFHECRLSAKWPSTLRPSQLTWAVSLSEGCHHLHPPSPFIITQPNADTHFIVLKGVEDWVCLHTLYIYLSTLVQYMIHSSVLI